MPKSMECPCGLFDVPAKDGRCRGCRMRSVGTAQRKYPWTEAMDAELKAIYRAAKGKADLTHRKKQFRMKFRLPFYIVDNRATQLGLRVMKIRPWTPEEIAYLEENAGNRALFRMAADLKRSKASVKHKLFGMGHGCAKTDGYSINEVKRVLGVTWPRVNGWITRGWLVMEDGQITAESLQAFTWDHIHEYRFSACDELWLKEMLKSAVAARRKPVQRQEAA